MECSGEKGLNKGRIHNNDTISLFSFTKDRLDMGRKRKYTTFARQHARHRCCEKMATYVDVARKIRLL